MTKWTRIAMVMVVVVILLTIVSGVARIILNHAGEDGSLPLEIVVWSTSFLIGLITLGALILGIWKGVAWFLNQLRLNDIEDVAGDPDVVETAHTMERLGGILDRVEQNRNEAQERILDIFTLTTELVGLVEAVSRKIRDLDGELNT